MRLMLNLPSSRFCDQFGRLAMAGLLVIAAAAVAVTPAAEAQTGGEAVYAVTYLDVGTDSVPQGIDLLKKYRESSGREGGGLEFTALQEIRRPNRFVIIEGWKDRASFESHD